MAAGGRQARQVPRSTFREAHERWSSGSERSSQADKRKEQRGRVLGVAFIDASVAKQMEAAQRTTEVKHEADFSYSCTYYAGDRWLLAGDAGSFLDLVFSTGVQLALEAGEQTAKAVDAAL